MNMLTFYQNKAVSCAIPPEVEESIEIITEMIVMAEVWIGTGLEKGHFLETLVLIETIRV